MVKIFIGIIIVSLIGIITSSFGIRHLIKKEGRKVDWNKKILAGLMLFFIISATFFLFMLFLILSISLLP
jgi:hypothetical protein